MSTREECAVASTPASRDRRASDDPAAGVTISNTPLQSSHWVGSEDWLEWVSYVNWNAAQWPELRAKLETMKALASESSSDDLEEWKVNGLAVNVEPSGARLGSGRKGPYFAFKMECAGLDILVGDRQEAHATIPNVVVRTSGEACLLHGSEACLKRGREFIALLGGVVVREKLSRVDVALDMPGVGMEDFRAAFNEGRYICRAKSRGYTESSGLTVRFGESPLMLRMYDKLAETMKCANALKRFAMIERRWGGTIPERAARVEFEFRREALKERGIDTVNDYFEKRADLVHYLTHGWFRLTVVAVDRENKNQSRAKVAEVWQDVQAGLAAWAGSPAGCSLEPLDRRQVDVGQLFKQALGVVRTAAEYQGMNGMTVERLLSYAMRGLRRVAKEAG